MVYKKKTNDRERKQVKINHALDLRLAGASYRTIAKEMDVSLTSAFNYVKEAIGIIQEKYTEKAKELVSMDLLKLNKMELGLYTAATSGDKQSVDAILKIMERRSRLLGLDAPVKKELEITTPEPVQFILHDNDEDSKDGL